MSNPSPMTTREWAEMHCETPEHVNSEAEVLCPVCQEPLADPEEVSKCFICKLHTCTSCGEPMLIGLFYEFVCDNCNPNVLAQEADSNE